MTGLPPKTAECGAAAERGAFAVRLPAVSFEFFPPKSAAMEQVLWQTVKRLAPFAPRFVSVTYGAGGSTRARTIHTIMRILRETDLEVAAHLTCVEATRAAVDAVACQLAALGVHRFVALRGDPLINGGSAAGGVYRPYPQGYAYAADLVGGLKRLDPDFDISVAAYPEKHPESADFAADIDVLKRKIDAGANKAITQAFFDNDCYERYLERLAKARVDIPVVPGILPIHNFARVRGFCARNGASLPPWLLARFDGLENDAETQKMVAAVSAAEQVQDLMKRGARRFHFYTLNQAELVYTICHLLGLRPAAQAGAPAAAAAELPA